MNRFLEIGRMPNAMMSEIATAKKRSIRKCTLELSAELGLLLLGGLLVTGCQASHKFSAVEPSMAQTGNRLEIGDQVTVKFSGPDQKLRDHEERITENGTITLPYIGSVKAAGKTAGELQAEVHGRYVPDYYKYLTVTVMGEQRVYYVGGRVRTPGRQFYIGTTTVTKAIQSAGDFDDFAARRRVVLTRANGETHEVDCVKATRNPSLDLPVYPNDKITVDIRGPFDFN